MSSEPIRLSFDELRERLAYQPVLLGAVALLAGAALTFAYDATREHIAAAEARDMQQTLAQVLPSGFADNDLLKDVVELAGPKTGSLRKVHLAKKAGVVSGAVFAVGERGYAGEISVLMAVNADGAILGVRVPKPSETPGPGDKIVDLEFRRFDVPVPVQPSTWSRIKTLAQ